MSVNAAGDYLLLKRQADELNSQFRTGAIGNTSPFFVVVDGKSYEPGQIVIPRPGIWIEQTIDGEQYYWAKTEDILGVKA